MTIGSWKVCVTAIATLLVAVVPARAQSVEAEALFRDGKRLIKEGDLVAGCDKIDASDRVEASVGTELNLGDCREKNHQLASAWAAFLKAAGNAKKAGNDKAREAEARSRAAKLEARLSYLTISVPEASRVAGLTIMRNGAPVDEALWNSGVPVDEGIYQISGQAPGHESWSTSARVAGEGAKVSVEVPRFKAIQELAQKANLSTESKPAEPAQQTPTDEVRQPGMFTTQRKIAVGVAVVGLAGGAAAVVFGLKAKDLQSQADELCPQASCNNQMAVDINDDAKRNALMSNVGLGVGIAGVAGAVALWILGAPSATAGSSHEDSDVSIRPAVGRNGWTLSLGGSF